jgi:uncharacterized protein YukE
MVDWLNHNAGAIEALTAIASLIVTGVLVGITWRYVRLTKKLAEAANAELLARTEAANARRRDLAANVQFLAKVVKSVPAVNRSDFDRLIRNSIAWDEFDFGHFRALASEVSPDAAHAAAEIESQMRRIQAIIAEVKSTPTGRGYDWSGFNWDEWEPRMRALKGALSSISSD